LTELRLIIVATHQCVAVGNARACVVFQTVQPTPQRHAREGGTPGNPCAICETFAVPELKSRGYWVARQQHDPHHGGRAAGEAHQVVDADPGAGKVDGIGIGPRGEPAARSKRRIAKRQSPALFKAPSQEQCAIELMRYADELDEVQGVVDTAPQPGEDAGRD
jgi:hypothetical protein